MDIVIEAAFDSLPDDVRERLALALADACTDPYAMTTPAYEAAIQACRHLVDDPANALPENQ
jgi:hypothetical protein